MSQVYVTPFLQGMFQHETGKFLAHTYTRISQTPSPTDQVDEWGQPVYTTAAPATNQPCFYAVEHGAIVMPFGVISQNVPLLTVPFDDPLTEGDHVSDIYTLSDPNTGVPAVLLLAGPVEVEAINERAPGYGGAMLRQASLRQIQAVGPA